MEEDSSDLYEEDMAMLARKFKKFFKKPRLEQGRNNLADPRTLTEISSLGVSNVARWITSSKIIPAKRRIGIRITQEAV